MDDFDPECLVAAHNQQIFLGYKRHQRHFTPKQWQVVCLRYERGLTVARIAELLGRVESTISSLLSRATEILDDREKELRRESYEVRRTLPEE